MYREANGVTVCDTLPAIWSCRTALVGYGDQHIGVHSYHRKTLHAYATLPKCKAEVEEGLEQLRWFHAGYKMHVVRVMFSGVEINSPDDVYRWEEEQQKLCSYSLSS